MQERLDYKDIALEMKISQGNASILSIRMQAFVRHINWFGTGKVNINPP